MGKLIDYLKSRDAAKTVPVLVSNPSTDAALIADLKSHADQLQQQTDLLVEIIEQSRLENAVAVDTIESLKLQLSVEQQNNEALLKQFNESFAKLGSPTNG